MPRKCVHWHIELSCKTSSSSLINSNHLKAYLMMFKTISLAASALLLVSTAAQALAVSGQGTWETTLQARDLDRDGVTDAFYDTELNVTWLRAVKGPGITPADAKTWASNLVVGGYGDWRLPFVVDTGAPGCDLSFAGGTDCGYNVQTKIGSTVYSEFAHLFYVTLGNKGACTPGRDPCVVLPSYGLSNTALFQNMLSLRYITGTAFPNPGGGLQESSWNFNTDLGTQTGVNNNNGGFSAMAVRPGDITVTAAIPEPETYAMMLGGLAASALVVRRRKSGVAVR